MNYDKRGFGRVALYLGVAGAMVVSILPSGAGSVAAQGQTRKIGNFDVSGRFLEQWSKQGSEQNNVYVNGLAITNRRPEISMTDGKTYETQWFERARYEAHPENKAPYDVLLGLLGVTLAEGRGAVDPATKQARNPSDVAFVGIDKPADTSATKVWFPESRHSASGKILEYWNKYGGLQQFGYPLSEQFQEVSATDGKTYTVQYFERNRFELHPEKAAPYEVELGLLGVQQYKQTPVPVSDLPIAGVANQATTKDTVVVALSQEPNSLNGIQENAYVTSEVLDALEEGVAGIDDKGDYYPESVYYLPTLENGGSYYVGIGPDRHLVTKYKIRRGVKWSDGQELDSNDFVFAYKLRLHPESSAVTRDPALRIANIENPDKYTVIYNWLSANQAKTTLDKNKAAGNEEEYAFLQQFITENRPVVYPLYWTVGEYLPEHVLSKIAPNQIIESPYARQGHVGTGPFKVERWLSGQEMTLVQNENYSLGPKPAIKRIVIKFIQDTNQIIAQLKTGDLDAASSESFPAPVEALDQLGANFTVSSVPNFGWEHADFNFRFAPFKDRAVREGIITAINRQRIVDIVLRGKGVVLHTPSVPSQFDSLQGELMKKKYGDKYKLPIYNYDVAKANQLLEAAGWVKGPDGIRAKGGQKLSFEYATTAANKTRETITQLVQADLKAVGVDAQLKYYVGGTEYFASAGILDRGVCQLCEFGWTGSPDPDYSIWKSSGITTEENGYSGQNYSAYSNPEFDKLADAMTAEIEQTKREDIGARAQILFMTDIVLIPLYPRLNIEPHKSNLVNHKTTNSLVGMFWNVDQWYFK